MTMPADVCRDPADLARALAAPLTPDDADALAAHLERCDRCAAAADRLLAADALTALLRSHSRAAAATSGPSVQALIDRVRRLRTDPDGTADLSSPDAHTLPPSGA